MNSILLLACSPHGTASQGSRLAMEYATRLDPQAQLVIRDLANEPLPSIDADYADAIVTSAPDSSPHFNISENLIAELEHCDYLLIATPMHNFTVPAALKLWIDHVVRIHRSFRATAQGKQGLLWDRPTFVFVSAGGIFQGEMSMQPDFLTPYLRHVLSTIGIHSVEFIAMQGLAHGDDARHAASSQARQQMNQYATPLMSVTGESHE
uniref:FMN-dependent NADH-azoreductase n=1 Tax=Halomonas sp. TaxID=1486246 RepID=UPI00263453A2|nr:NAD(P)H-dependent oxidoreductase [Halomonas sp.]